MVAISFVASSCGEKEQQIDEVAKDVSGLDTTIKKSELMRSELPDGIEWLTNESDPVFASPDAKKGGTLHLAVMSFPLTFRTVGPDSNSSFRSAILGNQLSLVGIHPNTENIIPEIATHWAFGNDKKTMYFKLKTTKKPIGFIQYPSSYKTIFLG